MPRRPLTVASALSVSLCVATVVLWARSYRYHESIAHTNVASVRGNRSDWTILEVGYVWGHVSVARIETANYWSFDPPITAWHAHHEKTTRQRWIYQTYGGSPNAWGFGRGRRTATAYADGMAQTTMAAIVPLWFLTVLWAVLPTTVVARWWQRGSRAATGHCVRCGYDLRATPDRCPECGTRVPRAQGTSA